MTHKKTEEAGGPTGKLFARALVRGKEVLRQKLEFVIPLDGQREGSLGAWSPGVWSMDKEQAVAWAALLTWGQ